MARPFVIAVAGPHSDSGKTSVVCSLIERWKTRARVAALKISTSTPDHRCARTMLPCSCLRFEGDWQLVDGEAALGREGKDTWRYREAGADPIWWLRTTSDAAMKAVPEVLASPPDAEVLIVEGAGPIRYGTCDRAVLIAPAPGREAKPGWEGLLDRADLLLSSLGEREAPQRRPELDPGCQLLAQDAFYQADEESAAWKALEPR